MNETSINQADLSWEKAESYPDGTMVKTLRRSSSGSMVSQVTSDWCTGFSLMPLRIGF